MNLQRIKNLAVLFILIWTAAGNVNAHVALDYPKGGETFGAGEMITIEWHIVIAHQTINWDLYFSSDGGQTWEPIQLDIPLENLTYNWIVPGIATTQGRVRIVQDNVGMDYDHMSTNFTIEAAAMPPEVETEAQDVTLSCNSSNQETAIQEWLNNHGGATVTHFCPNLTWTNNYSGLQGGCGGGTGSAEVTFTAMDDCGSVTSMATLTVEDDSPPVFDSPPTSVTMECDGTDPMDALNAWVANNGGAQISDGCGDFTVEADVGWDNPCGMINAHVNFIARDACDNVSSMGADFKVVDTTPPAIVKSARDTSFACDDGSLTSKILGWLSMHAGASAEDVCGSVTWSHNLSGLPDPCSVTEQHTVVFTASDQCGNTVSTSAKLTLTGSTATDNPDISRLEVNMYPNPATDYTRISFENLAYQEYDVTLVSASGQSVWSARHVHDNIIVPLNEVTRGIYFVEVNTLSEHIVRKLVVI